MKNAMFWLLSAMVVAAAVCGIIFVFSDRAAPDSAPHPTVPFLGMMIGGLALATILASLAAWLTSTGKGLPPSLGRKSFVWFLVWGITFFLWGSVGGQNDHTPDGELADGLTWYIDGGILRYLTVTSHQLAVGARWSHEMSIHPWPLVGTVALTLAVVVVPVLIARKWKVSNHGALPGAA